MRMIPILAAIFLAAPAIAQPHLASSSSSAAPRMMNAPYRDPWQVAGTHSPNLNLSDAIGSTSLQGRADDCLQLRGVPNQPKAGLAEPYQAVMTTALDCR